METPQYNRPPIEEAVCEFLFVPDAEWNFTVPGRLYSLLSGAYPAPPREQTVIRPGTVTPESNSVELIRAGTRIQFVNEPGDRLVGCGRDSLSIHVQRPYPGWEDCQARIANALKAYVEVLPNSAVCRVGVRYINRITVEGDLRAVAPLVKPAPFVLDGLRTNSMAYLIRTEAAYLDGSGKLLLTVATADAPAGSATLLVDIDVVWEGGDNLSPDDALVQVSASKARVSTVFESIITDEARRIFNG